MNKEFLVVKESGERELFDPAKAKKAVKRSGLSDREADILIKKLMPQLHENIQTRKIYSILFELIEERRPEVSHRFNLKRALLQLGPAGYVFEDFVARLLSTEGYKTEKPEPLQGKCIMHEVDIVAEKNGEVFMCECKFHNKPGVKCRIQDALYTYARFNDLTAAGSGGWHGKRWNFTRPWLISNTKFSEDVRQYSECMDFPILGWRYPFRNGLEERIDRTKCYPVTVIDMNEKTIQRLFGKGIITVFDVPDGTAKLASLTGIHPEVAERIVERARQIR